MGGIINVKPGGPRDQPDIENREENVNEAKFVNFNFVPPAQRFIIMTFCAT